MTAPLVRTRARERIMIVLTVAAVGEIGWTAYLALVLPPHYVARHWELAWVGLDVAEIVTLLACAWAAWRRRALLIPLSSVGATLFLLDAWFDVTTAGRGDFAESLLLALLVEVPGSIVLWFISLRALRAHYLAHGDGATARRARSLPLVPPPEDQ